MTRLRYSKRTAPIWLLLISLFVLLTQRYGWFNSLKTSTQTTVQLGYNRVVKFDDGDTIAVDINGSSRTVRFIGVDTPETHDPRKSVQCFGQAAASFTKNLIGNNSVRLENDAINSDHDKYNRLLRYIYLPNGTLVNAEIIKQGYGFAYLTYPFTKADEFHKYELDARTANKGLWANCSPQPNKNGGFTSNNAQ